MPVSPVLLCITVILSLCVSGSETLKDQDVFREETKTKDPISTTNESIGHLRVLTINDTRSDDEGAIILAVERLRSLLLSLAHSIYVTNSSGLLSSSLINSNKNVVVGNESTGHSGPLTSVTAKRTATNFTETEGSARVPSSLENQQILHRTPDDLSELGEDDYDDYKEAELAASSESNQTNLRRRITYRSYMRPWSTNKKCVRYSEGYLYRKMEQAGTLNQWYMANTPEEAGRNFAQSYQNIFEDRLRYYDAASVPLPDALPDYDDISRPFECNNLCQDIIWKLNEAVARESNHSMLRSPFHDDGKSHNLGAEPTKSTESNCLLEVFISSGKCLAQGEETEEHRKLCASCYGIYVLNKMCFPRFINAVKCQTHTSACIFDKISGEAHGSCYMRTLTFKVLHNRGSEECQEWYYEYIEVPASCECFLDARSVFLAATKP